MRLNLSPEQVETVLNVLGGYIEDAEIGEDAGCPCPDLIHLRSVLTKIETEVACEKFRTKDVSCF